VGGVDCATGLSKPAAGSGGQCTDRRAPVTSLIPPGLHRTSTRISLKGRSFDRGCGATATQLKRKGRVESVLVSIAKVRPRHGCRFLQANGRIESRGFHNCAQPILLMAKGTTRWHFSMRVHNLPAGDYRAVARGVDASQNKERPTHRRNVIRFAVR
jgi:hypothetical protein